METLIEIYFNCIKEENKRAVEKIFHNYFVYFWSDLETNNLLITKICYDPYTYN